MINDTTIMIAVGAAIRVMDEGHLHMNPGRGAALVCSCGAVLVDDNQAIQHITEVQVRAVAQVIDAEVSAEKADLLARIDRALSRLDERRTSTRSASERIRLDAKIDGVKLARSYLEETTR